MRNLVKNANYQSFGRIFKRIVIIPMIFLFMNFGLYGTTEDLNPAQLAFNERQKGNIDVAEKILTDSIKKNKKDPKLYFEYARLNFYTSDFKAALKNIDSAIELDNENSRFYGWRGIIYVYNGVKKAHNPITWVAIPHNFKKAAKDLERSLLINPDNHESRYLLICIYGNNPSYLGGNREKAAKHTQLLKTKDLNFWALSENTLNKKENRANAWLEAITKDPKDYRLYRGLAQAHQRETQYEKALLNYNKAIELSPKDISLLKDIADCYYYMGKNEEALKNYNDYLSADKNMSVNLKYKALSRIAAIENKMGNKEKHDKLVKELELLKPKISNAKLPDDIYIP